MATGDREEEREEESDSGDEQERRSESDDERKERKEKEVQEEKMEYMNFRREFDQIKMQHEGNHAESDKLKTQGNQFFTLGLYMQASMMYSEALELQPENAILYCNRSMAYLKQDMPGEALADAEKSLEIDSTETNIKAYWRKAQALLDMARFEESEIAADVGIALQASNQHLNRVRRKAREACTLKRLAGDAWVTKLENGVAKKYTFFEDGTMTMEVFGHSISATFDLSVEGNPRSMVVRMKPEGADSGPPMPPMVYIFEFQDNDEELWLCHPVGSSELPDKFEGPGFDRMRRAPNAPEVVESDSEPLDERCRRYIREMNEVMPVIPPQLPEKPSNEQVNEELQIMEKIGELKKRFGLEVHQRAVELAKDPTQASSEELIQLALELQQRFVSRKFIPQPKPKEDVVAPEEEVVAPVAEGVHQLPSPTLSPQLKLAPPQAGCFSGLVARLCGSSRN